MKLKSLFCLACAIFPASLWANWQNVGQADYNWGPFHVYTVSLYSETGNYQENQRPLMLSLQYAKPVEGKNFAITLMKEIDSLKLEGIDAREWRDTLKKNLPDFHPNDKLSYIALEDKGYFVLNDTVLSPEFDRKFNQAFIAIWLDPKGNFARLHDQLLGKNKAETANPTKEATQESPTSQPESAPLDENNADPKLFEKPEDKGKELSRLG